MAYTTGERTTINGEEYYWNGEGWAKVAAPRTTSPATLPPAVEAPQSVYASARQKLIAPTSIADGMTGPTPPPTPVKATMADWEAQRKGLPRGTYGPRPFGGGNRVEQTGAVQAVQAELGAPANANIVSRGTGPKALAAAKRRAQFDELAANPAMTEEQKFQQGLSQRGETQAQDAQFQQQEEVRKKAEFVKDMNRQIGAAVDTQLPPGSPAWPVQNRLLQIQDEIKQLGQFEGHGADPLKTRPRRQQLVNEAYDLTERLKDIQTQAQDEHDTEKEAATALHQQTFAQNKKKFARDEKNDVIDLEYKQKQNIVNDLQANTTASATHAKNAMEHVLSITKEIATMKATAASAKAKAAGDLSADPEATKAAERAAEEARKPLEDLLTQAVTDATTAQDELRKAKEQESRIRQAALSGMPIPEILKLIPAAPTGGGAPAEAKSLTPDIVAEYRQRAGGDKAKTRELLIADGYKVE
jgi:hypothetical protein